MNRKEKFEPKAVLPFFIMRLFARLYSRTAYEVYEMLFCSVAILRSTIIQVPAGRLCH
jgi:hypothetical protein